MDDLGTREAFLREGCLVSGPNGRAWIGVGPPRRQSCAERGKLSVYAPDFFLTDDAPWLVYDESADVDVDGLIGRLGSSLGLRARWSSSPFEAFAASFRDVQRRLAEGSLIKAVPFVERRARFEPDRAAVLASALRRCAGQPLRAYGFWNEREGMVGTTPETLFEERPRRAGPNGLLTMALAGTRGPGGASLLDDPKEVTEHRIVVEGIVERLRPLGRVAVGPTDELTLPTLAHLHTPIEVSPQEDVSFERWVEALHPTPAIGAWPKEAGWHWLHDQPNAARRGRYGAPFGFVPPDSDAGTCLVAIRNVQWADGEAKVLAGCGIVRESRVEREWKELNAKLDSIQGALGL